AAQHLEAGAAVAGAGDDQPGVDGDAALVLGGGHEPGGQRVARVGGDGKAEFGRTDRRELAPALAAVLGAEHAVVMLAPHDLGVRPAARELVNVLGDRVFAPLRRHVFVVHAAVDDAPRGALVAARPHPGGG